VGRWIRPVKRLAVYLRDRFRCLGCGRDLRVAKVDDVTLDHFIPRADGGGNRESNVYTSCKSCNCSRQNGPACNVKLIRRQLSKDLTPFKELAVAVMAGEVSKYEACR